jgi:hypothetical protein
MKLMKYSSFISFILKYKEDEKFYETFYFCIKNFFKCGLKSGSDIKMIFIFVI